MHPLVLAVVRDALDEAKRQCWAERAIRAVSAALAAVEHVSWSQWERVLTHALACAEWIEREGCQFQEATRLLWQTGWYLIERACYSEAEPLLERVYVISE